jgi:glycosyltransferase involved in cell wall biosynthesis
MPRPLLFVSDAISCTSGLGRITRDLAVRVHEHLGDKLRVACAGYGGNGSVRYPFPQYFFHSIQNWLLPELPGIVEDFAQGEEPIVMFVWDASRLYWLGLPQTCPDPRLRQWVENTPKKLWLYGAIDAEGPNGTVPSRIAAIMKGFDRVLDYTAFSSRITGNPDHLPHGIDTSVFYPRDRRESRATFIEKGFQGLTQDSLLIGIVATNQARKNWQLGMETAKTLLDRGHDVRVWAHVDVVQRYWDIEQLITDYGLLGRVAVTLNRFTDEEMAVMYSACNITLAIGPEGFGYPVAESLACGIPCIAGRYGGQSEFTPTEMMVTPVSYYYEGAFCSKRPVHDATTWADKTEELALKYRQVARTSLLPPCVDWNGPTLWPAWRDWFKEGL